MPHPESEHGLRVQLATALRERDEARGEAAMYKQRYFEKGADSQQWAARAGEAESALAAANAKANAAEAKLATALPCGNVLIITGFDEEAYENHEETISHVISGLREALAAARRECEGLREALRQIANARLPMPPRASLTTAHYEMAEVARKALAAPAAAAGEERKNDV